MEKNKFFLGIFLLVFQSIFSENYYIVYFKDKADGQSFTLEQPEHYLSERAILNRSREQIQIDSTDLPVCKTYIADLIKRGIGVIYTSKWLNAALVYSDSTQLKGLDFKIFRSYNFLGRKEPIVKEVSTNYRLQQVQSVTDITYGNSYTQLHMMNTDVLHNKGYTGMNILMAVFDEGFTSVDTLTAFKHIFEANKVIDTYSFVNHNNDVYSSGTHGTKVLSCIAAKWPGKMMGASYDVSIALYHTEDASQENPVEEFYYLLAAERADSIGVDIISTSLSYRDFDDRSLDHSYEDLNGQKTVAAFAARMLAKKGIILVTSAGNTGLQSFRTIGTPADADSIITVGAVNAMLERTAFSSIGPTVDGRIKPDVAAFGQSVVCIGIDGTVTSASGTSFATPLVAGFVALMKEVNPTLRAQELIMYIKQHSSNSSSPNNQIGYGVPYYGEGVSVSDHVFNVYFDKGYLYIKKNIAILEGDIENCKIYNLSGKLLFDENKIQLHDGACKFFLNQLSEGMYVALIALNGSTRSFLVIKNN